MNGIRTAASRARAKGIPRLPIATVEVLLVAKAIKRLYPKILRLHLVGSRLRHREARDLDFVAVVKSPRDFPNSSRVLNLQSGPRRVNAFFALPDEVETHILEFGLGLDDVRWKRFARAKGFKLNRYGLWRGAVRVSTKMKEIAAVLGLPLKPHLVLSLENPL